MKKNYVIYVGETVMSNGERRPLFFQKKDRLGFQSISDINLAFRFRTKFMAYITLGKLPYKNTFVMNADEIVQGKTFIRL